VLSLEPDLKRASCNPGMIDVASRQRAHISPDTRPWVTVGGVEGGADGGGRVELLQCGSSSAGVAVGLSSR
jgi:hypothetical protein